MWNEIVDEDAETLSEMSENAVRGAVYAELSASGVVELSAEALPYLESAHSELSDLSSSLSDEEDEDEE